MDNNNSPSKAPEKKRSTATILMILSIVIVIAAFFSMYPAFFAGAQKTAYIKIPRNATYEMLNDSLTKYEGKSYASHVMRFVRLRNTDLSRRTGAYEIRKGESPFVSMRRLTSGGQTPIHLTINVTRNLQNLAERISTKVEADQASIYAALTDPEILAEYDLTPENAKALIFNDTYDLFWTDSPKQIMWKIGNVYSRRWNEERRRKAKELGLTPAQVMTICSIVDEETNAVAEKGRVGRVYINRYNSGMKLQSDPTVRYALGDFSIRRVTADHLKVDSPYNTYKYGGLPPGPIRTTSLETVDEVLNSVPTFDIYMCAREDFSGRHNFAVTYEEHLENARRYRKALDERGIH